MRTARPRPGCKHFSRGLREFTGFAPTRLFSVRDGRADVPTLARGFVLDHEHADTAAGGTLELQYMTARRPPSSMRRVFCWESAARASNSGTGALDGWTTDNANQILNRSIGRFSWRRSPPQDGSQMADLTAQMNFFTGTNGTLSVPTGHLSLQLTVGPSGEAMSLSGATAVRQFVINHSIAHGVSFQMVMPPLAGNCPGRPIRWWRRSWDYPRNRFQRRIDRIVDDRPWRRSVAVATLSTRTGVCVIRRRFQGVRLANDPAVGTCR